MQIRPSADNRVGGVSSVKMQCESKDAVNAILFNLFVEFLLRITVPSLCKAELTAVHRRAVKVHHECNTKTTRGNSSDAASV